MYRNESNQRYSKQLFWEQWITLPIEQRLIKPPFTLHNEREGYVCFGQEYVNDADPTGYTTSKRLLGDFGYWRHLLKAAWFREALELWNEELDAKLKAEGLKVIRETAASDDKAALAAARYLANLDYKNNSPASKRGRPSKEEVEGRLASEARELKDVEEDYKRIQLVHSK